MDLEEIGWMWTAFIGLRIEIGLGSCEHGDELWVP
jgi:hypothetical protein